MTIAVSSVKRSGFTSPRKPMKQRSDKRVKQYASSEGKADLAYMGRVKQLPCCVCGAPPPSDAHHAKDKPPHVLEWIYQQLPYGRKSGPKDTIPLCKPHHQDHPQAYHVSPASWNEANGPDYGYILETRRQLGEGE